MSCTSQLEFNKYPRNYQTFTNGQPTVPTASSPFYTVPDLNTPVDSVTGLGQYTDNVLNNCCPCPDVVAYNPKCSQPQLTMYVDSVESPDCFMTFCEYNTLYREQVAALKTIAVNTVP